LNARLSRIWMLGILGIVGGIVAIVMAFRLKGAS
jgi:hypothetical protein